MDIVYLFVPGNSERKIEKGIQSDADVIILDLEDAVPSHEKAFARTIIKETLEKLEDIIPDKKVFVRINSITTPWFFDDLNLINSVNVNGIMIPKSESDIDIKVIDEKVVREVEIIPLIETAKGVLNCGQIIQSSTRVKKVSFGSVDFALDIGTDWTNSGEERKQAMGQIVLSSRAFGAEAPIDAVFPVLDNEELFVEDVNYGKKVGFSGKMIIHPKHIKLVKDVYQPTPEKLEWSKKVVDRYENTDDIGAIELNGKLIDLPVYKLAKKLLEANEQTKI